MTLPVRKVLIALAVAAASLQLAGLAVVLGAHGLGASEENGFVRLLDVRREGNLPTLFSALTLLLVVGVTLTLARVERSSGRDGRVWLLLAVLFAYLAVDEAASIHELASGPVSRSLGVRRAGAWLLPGAVATLAVLAVLARHVRKLPRRTKRTVALAAACYVGGAIGVEFAEALAVPTGADVLVDLLGTVEESLEMAGILLFLLAFGRQLAEQTDGVLLRTCEPAISRSDNPSGRRLSGSGRATVGGSAPGT